VAVGGANDEREAVHVASHGYRQQRGGNGDKSHDRQPSCHADN
jgi:hypothetical protein